MDRARTKVLILIDDPPHPPLARINAVLYIPLMRQWDLDLVNDQATIPFPGDDARLFRVRILDPLYPGLDQPLNE